MLQSNDFFTPLTNEREIITALEDWSRVGFFKKKELGIDESLIMSAKLILNKLR